MYIYAIIICNNNNAIKIIIAYKTEYLDLGELISFIRTSIMPGEKQVVGSVSNVSIPRVFFCYRAPVGFYSSRDFGESSWKSQTRDPSARPSYSDFLFALCLRSTLKNKKI